ncbi:MAG: hypothetical protein K8T90_16425 [Planctomycetes bacterium]|nr:hypothetical protein [Planctomycetota bacterium]
MKPITRALAASIALILGGLARPHVAQAQDDGELPVTADAAADLTKALDAWDHRAQGGFTNTIPFEKAVLRGAAEGAPEAVVAHVTHERYGALLFAALCERRPQGEAAAKLVEAFAAMEPEARVGSAISIAALGTDAARAALRELAAVDAFLASGPPNDAIRAALVRSGDAAAVADVRKGLASKDVGDVAKSLLLAGDARATEFLADAARLADDVRKLPAPIASHWSETKTTKSEDGLTTRSDTIPVNLATLGDIAVEAANRMGASTLPGWVAWWYEIEKGPRFGRGVDGAKLVRQVAAEDTRAAKTKAPGLYRAIAAVQAAVRPTVAAMSEWKLVSATFDRGWTIAYRIGDAPGTATVDGAGKVTVTVAVEVAPAAPGR